MGPRFSLRIDLKESWPCLAIASAQSSAGQSSTLWSLTKPVATSEAGSQAGCFSDHLNRSTQEQFGNCWGFGTGPRSSHLQL